MEKQRARPAREWWEPCLGWPPRIDWVVDQKRRSVTTYRTLPALVRIAISRNAMQPYGTVGVDVGLVAVLVGIGAGCSLAHAGSGSTHPGHVTLILRLARHAVAVVDVRATIRRAVDESVAARAFGATLESRVLPTAPHHRAEWSSRVAMSKSPPNASSAVLKRSVPRHCQRDDGRMTLSLSPR